MQYTYKHYRDSDFDDHGTVKVSTLLWIIGVYLSRHALILALGGLSTFLGQGRADLSGLSALYSSPPFLASSLPALAFLSLAIRRTPAAAKWIRSAWRNGRMFLLSAAALDFIILLAYWRANAIVINQWTLTGAIADIYIAAYLARSKRVRDTFADFPGGDRHNP